MPFCIQCGQQNRGHSQFCIRCGKSLPVKPGATPQSIQPPPPPVQNIGAPVSSEPARVAMPSVPANSNKGLLVALLVIGILGLGIGAYFAFFNKNKNSTEQAENKDLKEATGQNSNTTTANNPDSILPETRTSDTAKTTVLVENPRLKQLQPDGTSNSISEYELDQVSKTINGLYNAENRDDINAVLSYFTFPADRYYDMRNVSYYALKNRFDNAMVAKLRYHHITPDYETSQVKKTGNSYFVTLSANFEYITYKTPGETKNRNIIIKLMLNSDYKITSVYE